MPSTHPLSQPADQQADRRHAAQMAALLRAVLESPGATEPALRQSVYHGDPVAGPLGAYLDNIRGQSYRITDEDVQRLLEAGTTQDTVFELTVVAALGAAAQRLQAGLRAMREER